ISGIDELRANSDQGNSRVTINFTLEREIESAVQDVRDKVSTIVSRFPRDTRPPTIQKVDPDAQPILSFGVSGPRSQKELSAITFADVGHVQDGVQEIRNASRLNGVPAISMQIRKQSGTNTVDVVDRVEERLNQIKATLPPDLKISIGQDQSRFIRRSFEDIKLHLILGGLLASAVVFLFIRNLRVTFIAALAIPT